MILCRANFPVSIMKCIDYLAQFQFSILQNGRYVSTQLRQCTATEHTRAIVRTCCVHVGADAKEKDTAIDIN
jgi:hypothetical protein